ncbi:uncharacterized protein LOC110242751 [Exaiptasia diaphana]|uniref:Uncharacterized protein n=1 Tax=Exaiptasia diaphana TaxID=2652724 RepID=A0A913YNA6_EXADI|nr:uncharacterized protein LOC110232761 [Exaiptasia diaphana]XP_028515977.1 uncharacterized protein LOC110242751 [Exaiptasia diaphana]
MSEVGKKQKSRKLKQLKDRAQAALWFSKSFGLDITNISFKDVNDVKIDNVNYKKEIKWSKGSKRYENLYEEEHERLEQIVFLLDKFYVSDECYHELSLVTNDIPQSYLIKQKRDNLNSLCHIERVPGPHPCAQRSFDSMLKESVTKYLDSHPSHDLTKDALKAINDLGITFSIWEKLNAAGKSSGQKNWISLVGSDKEKLLKLLPEKLKAMDVLFTETKSNAIKLWEDFFLLYQLICSTVIDNTTSNKIHENGKQWITSFCSLGSKRIGYGKARVTPYMHTIPYHIPKFISKHGSLSQFTGQGVEKNNDDARAIYYQKSNKWDAACDILVLESRQKALQHHERIKRHYTKRNMDWWDTKIVESRKKKQKLLHPQRILQLSWNLAKLFT